MNHLMTHPISTNQIRVVTPQWITIEFEDTREINIRETYHFRNFKILLENFRKFWTFSRWPSKISTGTFQDRKLNCQVNRLLLHWPLHIPVQICPRMGQGLWFGINSWLGSSIFLPDRYMILAIHVFRMNSEKITKNFHFWGKITKMARVHYWIFMNLGLQTKIFEFLGIPPNNGSAWKIFWL